MMAMTTNNSMSVKPAGRFAVFESILLCLLPVEVWRFPFDQVNHRLAPPVSANDSIGYLIDLKPARESRPEPIETLRPTHVFAISIIVSRDNNAG